MKGIASTAAWPRSRGTRSSQMMCPMSRRTSSFECCFLRAVSRGSANGWLKSKTCRASVDSRWWMWIITLRVRVAALAQIGPCLCGTPRSSRSGPANATGATLPRLPPALTLLPASPAPMAMSMLGDTPGASRRMRERARRRLASRIGEWQCPSSFSPLSGFMCIQRWQASGASHPCVPCWMCCRQGRSKALLATGCTLLPKHVLCFGSCHRL
mmetsp:Transcript_52899/g.104385  ORF Transcript_52899/g.104385 Transcript_52899/m.104385 type:complete len:213 (+) Transcript_52899:383-1021(+)